MSKGKSIRQTQGRFIVFEGIDGSGKTTQVNLLLKFLKNRKIAHQSIKFPNYQNTWGKLIRRYLDGDFGKVDQVSPYLASCLYAGDRLLNAQKIRELQGLGKLVFSDRYLGSNLAHMGGKIKNQKSKIKFIEWLENFEYQENKIPKEDLVIFLSIPADFSQKLMRARKLDIHESDVSYLKKVSDVFEMLAKKNNNWVKIDSVENGKLLPPQKIHEQVLEILQKRNILHI